MELFNIESLEVKDEILNGEPLYVIKDSSGKVIYDNVKLELKTPLIQEGTPINKSLFDKIDYIGQCLATMDKTGEDIFNFITTGIYDNNVTIPEQVDSYRLLNLENEVSSIKSQISSIQSQISSIQSGITSIKSRLKTLEGK